MILVEDFSERRAEILRRYVTVAPGARPHVPVDRKAPIEAFRQIVADYPIFKITAEQTG